MTAGRSCTYATYTWSTPVVTRRSDPTPSGDGPDALSRAIVSAGKAALEAKLAAYMDATTRATRSYLHSLALMHEAARVGAELRAASLDIGPDLGGTAENLAAQFRQVARAAVAGGLIRPDDELVAGLVTPPGTEPAG